MKKRCIFYILILISYIAFCDENNIELQLSIPITEAMEILGKPQNTSIDEFSYNHDFDMICYEYESFEIYSYRVSQAISKIRTSSKNLVLNIDEKKIFCGLTKLEIDSLFKEGTLDGKDSYGNKYYYYPLSKLREFDVLYNESNIAIEIIYGYSTP